MYLCLIKQMFSMLQVQGTLLLHHSLLLFFAGAPPKYAAIIGNIAASIVIRSFGCATTSVEEIKQSLNKMNMQNYIIKV